MIFSNGTGTFRSVIDTGGAKSFFSKSPFILNLICDEQLYAFVESRVIFYLL